MRNINVTGPAPVRTIATAERFGARQYFPTGEYTIVGRTEGRMERDPSRKLTLFTDEFVDITTEIRSQDAPPALPLVDSAVVQATTSRGIWTDVAEMAGGPRWERGTSLHVRVRLKAGVSAFRVLGDLKRGPYESMIFPVRVKPAPALLTFIAMGGSGSGGSSGSGSGSSSSSGSSGSSSGDGIVVDRSRCSVDPTLVPQLMRSANIGCNDLCADCLNFVEHLGVRLFADELAHSLRSLKHKEQESQSDHCAERTNPSAIKHRVVLGKWENSEHEHFRPPPIKTFESILDEYDDDGGGTLLIVANSLAGAKLAATVKDHWRWGNRIAVALFVSWDSTHLGGGIASVGSRPRRVINFFQTGNILPFQNGSSIGEADREFNLTGCFSHNALPRSVFVHDTTFVEVRDALAQRRADVRAA